MTTTRLWSFAWIVVLRGAVLVGSACGSRATEPDHQGPDAAEASDAPETSTSYACNAPPPDLTACANNDDCATVDVGCYCGSQPVIGVALKYATTAAMCQQAESDACTRGCVTVPGRQAQDGMMIPDGQPASVRCDLQGAMTGTTGICTTYVP